MILAVLAAACGSSKPAPAPPAPPAPLAAEWEIDRAGKPVSAKRPHVEAADPCAAD